MDWSYGKSQLPQKKKKKKDEGLACQAQRHGWHEGGISGEAERVESESIKSGFEVGMALFSPALHSMEEYNRQFWVSAWASSRVPEKR
jgi:hypothetical protein